MMPKRPKSVIKMATMKHLDTDAVANPVARKAQKYGKISKLVGKTRLGQVKSRPVASLKNDTPKPNSTTRAVGTTTSQSRPGKMAGNTSQSQLKPTGGKIGKGRTSPNYGSRKGY